MTDRELLELAAKAADVAIGDYAERICDYYGRWDGAEAFELRDGGYWNPLADDADALRLAVELHLTARFYMGETIAQSSVPGGPSVYITDKCHRRAIVRAAAEIGRAA